MSTWIDGEAFGEREVFWTNTNLAATPFQLANIGEIPPANAKATIIRIYITSQATANVIKIWDADLTASGAGITTRGGAATPIFTFNVPALTAGQNTDVNPSSLPRMWFQAGIAAQTANANTAIVIEYVKTVG